MHTDRGLGIGGLLGESSESRLHMELVNPDKASGEEEVESGNLKGRVWILHCSLRKERP